MNNPQRNVLTEDAVKWLEQTHTFSSCSFVASLPDISEFPQYNLVQWKDWFTHSAKLIFSQCPPDGVVIFYQSDIKHDGVWVDKGYLCQKAAELIGFETLWHKIICRAPAGAITFGRPAYSHILCFSKSLRVDISKSTADVMPSLGEKTWERGMGLDACIMIAKFVSEHTSSQTIVNPFCGHGSMLAAANALGLNAIGIERSSKRAEKARVLSISSDLKRWNES